MAAPAAMPFPGQLALAVHHPAAIDSTLMPTLLRRARHLGIASLASPLLPVARIAFIALAALIVLGGCVSPPGSQRAPLDRWTQLGPAGAVSLRAIVAADDECPTALVDGHPHSLLQRAAATAAKPPAGRHSDNPAYQPDFPVQSCELSVPTSTRRASIAGQIMPLPKTAIRRIVIVGDTGCRIKASASQPGPPVQDCSSPTDWPWQRIAAAAARTRPDLVIHLGDYHYREYCDDPTRCPPAWDPDVAVGYGWPGWHADFFTPAAPLLAAAPWIMLRGNHENCDRAGDGWMRFLSPLPYQACGDQFYRSASRSVLANNLTADAYRVDVDENLTLVIADNAGAEDYFPATARAADVGLFERHLQVLDTLPAGRPAWLLAHRPIWYDMLAASAQPNALQVALRKRLPANVQLAFSGHQHVFQTINFSPTADAAYHPAGRPAQIVVGGGGTELEAYDPESPFYEGACGPGSKERARPDRQSYDGATASSGIVVNRYSFLLLERDANDRRWSGTLLDPDGVTLSDCRLNGERKEILCSFPAR